MKAIILASILLMTVLNTAIAQTPQHAKCCGKKSTQFPFKNLNARKTQLWYNPADFAPTPVNGNITRIYFVSQTAGQSGTYENLTVSLKQPTTGNGFTATNFEGGMTQVYSNPNVTINGAAAAGGWYFITLNTPFAYDNTKPLVVEITYTNPTTIPGGGLDNWGTDATVPPNKKLYASAITAATGTTSNGFWQDFGFDISTASPTCTTPTGLAATNITSATATVTWNPVATTVGYEYAVDQNAVAPATGTATNAVSINVNSLTPSTNYYLHVRNKCAGNTFSAWADFPFTTLPPCKPPIGFKVTNLAPTSATINWSVWPSATAYDYYVNKVNTPPATPITTAATSIALNPLEENTWYYVYVRSKCAAGENSDWYIDSFLTPFKCHPPQIKISDINTAEAVAYWEPVNTARYYEYAITKSATPPALGTKYNFTSIHTAALQDGVDYYIHVKSHCESRNVVSQSDWSTASFKTISLNIPGAGGDKVSLNLYPNPVSEQLHIEVKGYKGGEISVSLTDMYGKVVRQVTLGNKNTVLDMAGLATGMYLLHYTDGGHTATIKVDKL